MAITITDCNSTSPIRKRYDVTFFGDTIYTTVTNNPTAVTDWIDDIMYLYHPPELMVGLDVEWRPSFTAGHRNRVAVLQLCVSDLCLVYQIIHSDSIPKRLVDFLSRDYNFVTFVGVGIKSDLEKLEADYGIGGGALYEDLREFAAEEYNRKELKNAGLKELGRVVMGKEVEMPAAVTVSRWDERELTAEQVQYACVDAFMSYEIGKMLGIK